MRFSEMSMQSNESKLNDAKELLKKWGPLVGFLAGFGWDSWTLGQMVSSFDLYILGIYLLIGYFCLFFNQTRFQKWTLLGFHFAVGTLLSALVILYFKSAASVQSFFIIVALAIFMTLNEFVGEKKFGEKLRVMTLWWVSFMFLNFSIPHVFKSVSSIWFYISLILSVSIIYYTALKLRLDLRIPLAGVTIVTFALWMGNFLPPVPLVLKEQFVGTALNKQEYQAELLYAGGFLEEDQVVLRSGEPLVYLNSIFAPSEVEAKLFHEWSYRAKPDDDYQLLDKIPLRLANGGRIGGWRFFSRKNKVMSGDWRVQTKSEAGATISSLEFRLAIVQDVDSLKSRKTKRLN